MSGSGAGSAGSASAAHGGGGGSGGGGSFARTNLALAAAHAHFGTAAHPVVSTHPATGRRALFVNEAFTAHVLGLSAPASRSLLDHLFAHLRRPEFQVRISWRPGMAVAWDNLVTQHYAVANCYPAYRKMHRVVVN
jgi:alpha-ketoglutarate-dependent taurine dioxygenase